jgi:hypothetical protein
MGRIIGFGGTILHFLAATGRFIFFDGGMGRKSYNKEAGSDHSGSQAGNYPGFFLHFSWFCDGTKLMREMLQECKKVNLLIG